MTISFVFFSKIVPVPFKQSNRVMAMARRAALPSIHLARSKFQDFDPKSEWKEEDHAYFLILHLPGFSKEQIRITLVHSSQAIRVHGERPIGNSMWSRFDKPFLLPPNSLSDKIYGRFQHGFLTVTIPKQTLPAKPQPKPTSPFPENERQTSEDEDQKRQKEAASSTSSALEDNLREHRPEVGRAGERSVKAEPEVSEKIAEKQMESREKVDSDAEWNPENEVKRKESLSEADESHQLKTEKEENESPEKQKITDRTAERIPGKTPEITEKARKGKEEERNSDENGKDTKQKLKILSKRLEEEEDGGNKQMLINIGAALLVLLAIGAYTAFNFSSFPKSRN